MMTYSALFHASERGQSPLFWQNLPIYFFFPVCINVGSVQGTHKAFLTDPFS